MKVRYRRFVRQTSPGFPVRKTGATPAAVCELSGWKTRFAGEAKQMVPACCQCRGTGPSGSNKTFLPAKYPENPESLPAKRRAMEPVTIISHRQTAGKKPGGKVFWRFRGGRGKGEFLRDGIRKSPFSAAMPCGDNRVPSGALRFRGRTIRRHGAVPACFAGCRCRR